MPHVIIKLYPGRTEAEKERVADRMAEVLHETLAYPPENVSVVVEEVAPERWMEDVYEPDIRQRQSVLFKRPGYGPLSWSSPEDPGRAPSPQDQPKLKPSLGKSDA